MSGWTDTQTQARRRRLYILASVAVAVAGAGTLWRFGLKDGPLPAPKFADQAPCIALAIDRETGIAVAEPCSGSRMLVAEQAPSR